MLFDTKTIDDLAIRLANKVQPSVNALKTDVEKNTRAILQSTLSKLDLVSREEFEVQKLVLSRTRAKLDALEQRIAELEKRLLEQEQA